LLPHKFHTHHRPPAGRCYFRPHFYVIFFAFCCCFFDHFLLSDHTHHSFVCKIRRVLHPHFCLCSLKSISILFHSSFLFLNYHIISICVFNNVQTCLLPFSIGIMPKCSMSAVFLLLHFFSASSHLISLYHVLYQISLYLLVFIHLNYPDSFPSISLTTFVRPHNHLNHFFFFFNSELTKLIQSSPFFNSLLLVQIFFTCFDPISFFTILRSI